MEITDTNSFRYSSFLQESLQLGFREGKDGEYWGGGGGCPSGKRLIGLCNNTEGLPCRAQETHKVPLLGLSREGEGFLWVDPVNV